jgi:hypothetical protein
MNRIHVAHSGASLLAALTTVIIVKGYKLLSQMNYRQFLKKEYSALTYSGVKHFDKF